MILHCVQTFAGTPDRIFPFFADARNLEAITPPWLNFRILTEGPIEMREGALIDYALRMNGIGFRWRTEIAAWEPQWRFVDRQIKGPYRRWVHEHRFIPRDGNTEMHDVVDYRAPLDFLSEPLFVRPRVKKIFAYRQRVLAERFETVGAPTLEIRQDPPPSLTHVLES